MPFSTKMIPFTPIVVAAPFGDLRQSTGEDFEPLGLFVMPVELLHALETEQDRMGNHRHKGDTLKGMDIAP